MIQPRFYQILYCREAYFMGKHKKISHYMYSISSHRTLYSPKIYLLKCPTKKYYRPEKGRRAFTDWKKVPASFNQTGRRKIDCRNSPKRVVKFFYGFWWNVSKIDVEDIGHFDADWPFYLSCGGVPFYYFRYILYIKADIEYF